MRIIGPVSSHFSLKMTKQGSNTSENRGKEKKLRGAGEEEPSENTKLGQVRPGRSRQAEIMLLGTGRELAMPGHLPSPKAWHQATLGETQRVAQDCRWT